MNHPDVKPRELTAEEFAAREEERYRIVREAMRSRKLFAYYLLPALIMRARRAGECRFHEIAGTHRLNRIRARLIETINT